MIYAISTLAVSAIAIVSLCSFSSRLDTTTELHADGTCEGKHCSYTVGCSCPGFKPIQHQEVYKLSYCKYCGHHRKYHK